MGSNSVAAVCAIAATACVLSCGKTQAIGDGVDDDTEDGTGGSVSAVAGGGKAASGGAKSSTGGEPTGGLSGDPFGPNPGPRLDTCGDGVVNPGEDCDDANAAPGDGCDGECQVEAAFVCVIPGEPCSEALKVCEDGCFAGDLCVERDSGFECECPDAEPDPCSFGIRNLSRNENARCTPYAISNDGTTVAGICDVAANGKRSTSMVLWHLGESPSREELPNTSSYVPTALSADGSVIVGRCSLGTFYWTRQGTEFIRHDGFRQASVSADGKTVVGTRGIGPFQPFLWTKADGMVLLPDPEGGGDSMATAISDDGSVIGGTSYRSDSTGSFAIRWNASREVEWLSSDDMVTSSMVTAASADGSTLGGLLTRGEGTTQGVIWSENGRATQGDLVVTISDDGSDAVGRSGDFVVSGTSVGESLPASFSQYWSSLTVNGASGDLKVLVGTASPNTNEPSGYANEAIVVFVAP